MRIRSVLAACLLVSATGIPAAAPASARAPTPAAYSAVVQGDVTGVLDPLIGSTVTIFDATRARF